MINNNFVTFRFILKAITLGLFLTTSSTFAQKRNPIKNSTALPSANILKIKSVAEQTYSHYEAVYEQLHKNPELSGMEKETSDAIAAELGILKKTFSSANAKLSGNNSKLQIEINRGVGGGYGIVTIIKNGSGPIILLRADMDALPIKEETGLQFESTKRVDAKGNRLPDGSDAGTPVMHACGHDVHMTVMLGVLNNLMSNASAWHGTIVAVFQPSEEKNGGSAQMIADGLFTRFPKPSYALCFHTFPDLPAGKVGYIYGPSMAGVRNYTITIYGEGTHGGYPHRGKDPIPAACSAVLQYQTIVSRTIPATKSAVLTVGAFNAGSRPNIVPDSVVMQATTRFFDNATDSTFLKRIHEITFGAAEGLGMPENKMPRIVTGNPAPPVVNDAKLVRIVKEGMSQTIGANNLVEIEKVMGAEDFARYLQIVPGALFRLGVSPADKPTGELHTSKMKPEFHRTWMTGVEAMTGGVIYLMNNLK
jgi:amidohydrolase